MTLPALYRRCEGRLGFSWQVTADECPRRAECLRYIAGQAEKMTGQQVGQPMQQCVGEDAFLALDAFEPREDE